MKCKYCNKDFKKRSNKKYCSRECKEKYNRLKKYLEKKKFILDYKENKKCSVCGWNKFTPILEFHHKDKNKKDYEISKLCLRGSRNYKRLNEEMKKCVLLCPNCHKELHYREVSLF